MKKGVTRLLRVSAVILVPLAAADVVTRPALANHEAASDLLMNDQSNRSRGGGEANRCFRVPQ